jgi:hypothetical protein
MAQSSSSSSMMLSGEQQQQQQSTPSTTAGLPSKTKDDKNRVLRRGDLARILGR